MKKNKLTALGFKRLSKATPQAYYKRAKDIEANLLKGEYKGQKIKAAKKRYQFCMWKYRSTGGADKQAANKIAQMIFPQVLREMGVTPIDDLFIKRTLQEVKKLAKKSKSKKRKAS